MIRGICGCKELHKTPNEECKTLKYVEVHMNMQIYEENSISAHYIYSEKKPEKYYIYTYGDYIDNGGKILSRDDYNDYIVAGENYKSPILTFTYNYNLFGMDRYEKEEELLKLAEEWNPKILAEVNRKVE